MPPIHTKRWLFKEKIYHQPRQGDVGLYKHTKPPHGGWFWSEDFANLRHPEKYTPVLFRTRWRARHAGRRFAQRHSHYYPYPVPLEEEGRL